VTVAHNSYFRLAACGLFILTCVFSLAQNSPQPFSSDYISTVEGSEPITGKIYFSWPYYRMDTGAIVSIVNYKTKTSYKIFRDKREYFETRAPEYAFVAEDPCAKRPDITCKKIGPETANGRTCEKWETTDKKSGHLGNVCVDRELHFPIRVRNPNGVTFDYINIKVGSQEASIFEIPDGYKKISDPFASR
jgi:hypothetical protein